jgi:Protein of unknown function (DUF4058)
VKSLHCGSFTDAIALPRHESLPGTASLLVVVSHPADGGDRRYGSTSTAPQLLHRIEVETRTYQDQEEPEEILVGIPDAAVLAARSTDQLRPLQVESGATLTQKQPRPILLPQLTTIKERYLEVREVGTDTRQPVPPPKLWLRLWRC